MVFITKQLANVLISQLSPTLHCSLNSPLLYHKSIMHVCPYVQCEPYLLS